jgi:hypothetical protein
LGRKKEFFNELDSELSKNLVSCSDVDVGRLLFNEDLLNFAIGNDERKALRTRAPKETRCYKLPEKVI